MKKVSNFTLTEEMFTAMDELKKHNADNPISRGIDNQRDQIAAGALAGGLAGVGAVHFLTRKQEGSAGTLAAGIVGTGIALSSLYMKDSEVVKMSIESESPVKAMGIGTAVTATVVGLLVSAIFD